METTLNWKHSITIFLLALFIPLYGQKLPDVRVDQSEVSEETAFIEATRHRMMSNYDKAETKLKALISRYDGKAVYYAELAKVYAEVGAAEQSLEAINTAIQKDSDNDWYVEQRIALAIENQWHDVVIESYESLLKKYPHKHEHLRHIAFHQLQNNEAELAIRTLSTLEGKTGRTYETTRQKHIIYDGMKQYGKAADVLDDHIAAHPEDMQVLQIAASYALKNDKNKKAEKYFDQILSIDPHHVQAKSALMQLRAGDSVQNEDLSNFINDPNLELDDKIFHLIPILTEIQEGKKPVALDELESHSASLIKQYGENGKTLALQADILALNNKIPEATAAYKASINKNDENYLVWESLLYLLAEQNEAQDLMNYAEEAMDIFPNKPMPHAFLAYSDALQKRSGQAQQSLERARIIAGNNKNLLQQIEHMSKQIDILLAN